MKKPLNIQALRDTIEEYKNMNLDRIEDAVATINSLTNMHDKKFDADIVAERLTGFGNMLLCKICFSVQSNCNKCVLNKMTDNVPGEFSRTLSGCLDDNHIALIKTTTPQELLDAYHGRAKYLTEKFKHLL